MGNKIIFIDTVSTDQYQFDSVGDALNYIEELIEDMNDESMTVYVKDKPPIEGSG